MITFLTAANQSLVCPGSCHLLISLKDHLFPLGEVENQGSMEEGSRVIQGGEVIVEGVSEFEFVLPGEQVDYIFLEVEAPGYKEWEVGFRHQLSHSRTYPLLVELEPMPTQPAPQA